jgi:hypothetical protein
MEAYLKTLNEKSRWGEDDKTSILATMEKLAKDLNEQKVELDKKTAEANKLYDLLKDSKK